jgi:hypothetical protein
MFGERLDLTPRLPDYEIVNEVTVFSPTVYAFCRALATSQEKPPVDLNGDDEGTARLRAVHDLGAVIKGYRGVSINLLGRYMLGEENVHPGDRARLAKHCDAILTSTKKRLS